MIKRRGEERRDETRKRGKTKGIETITSEVLLL
jgi:hypothetical protein